MPELPQIPALTPSSIPASDAIDFPATWFPRIAFEQPDPAGKKGVRTTSTNYNPTLQRLSPLAGDVQELGTDDLDADASRYPAVAATMLQFLGTLARVRVVWYLRGKIDAAGKALATAQATLAATRAKLADYQARLARQQALPDGPAKAEVLPDTEAQIATLTAAVPIQTQAVADAQAALDTLNQQMAAAEASLGYVAPTPAP